MFKALTRVWTGKKDAHSPTSPTGGLEGTASYGNLSPGNNHSFSSMLTPPLTPTSSHKAPGPINITSNQVGLPPNNFWLDLPDEIWLHILLILRESLQNNDNWIAQYLDDLKSLISLNKTWSQRLRPLCADIILNGDFRKFNDYWNKLRASNPSYARKGQTPFSPLIDNVILALPTLNTEECNSLFWLDAGLNNHYIDNNDERLLDFTKQYKKEIFIFLKNCYGAYHKNNIVLFFHAAKEILITLSLPRFATMLAEKRITFSQISNLILTTDICITNKVNSGSLIVTLNLLHILKNPQLIIKPNIIDDLIVYLLTPLLSNSNILSLLEAATAKKDTNFINQFNHYLSNETPQPGNPDVSYLLQNKISSSENELETAQILMKYLKIDSTLLKGNSGLTKDYIERMKTFFSIPPRQQLSIASAAPTPPPPRTMELTAS